MKKITLMFFATVLVNSIAQAQKGEEIALYAQVPGAINSDSYKEQTETVINVHPVLWTTKVSKPSLTYFKAANSSKTDAAVIICPGGGYGGLAISHEGYDVAAKFAEMGVSAFVLKYRLPSDEIMMDRKIGPLQDAQQAIKYVRENAFKYGINPNKIGIMGFSAGGHLASTASTHFKRECVENKKHTSLRPDFSILMYPVITFWENTHIGSRENLIGKNPPQELIDLYSNEKQVTKETPITFIIHSNDDDVVPIENAFGYIRALNNFGVKNEAHIYALGGHGYGLDFKRVNDVWFDRLTNWMKNNDLL
ncbi:esterase/lipase [Pseudopedobacter saltans DSM 12145]|uniref:Esterase/lipase n=1 Tax=Pseudopedobacter saltans (strain ATCC 51119 / DSM 12145 / JCM 21818 / CCUG 39354 / LMG 10337 / NBRC 100064 / NCIMB 13643) TaxID=762903 RepID=F0SA73_PSESL|nr:alpha/beta hydrolase [Pseudopedobacter saltans]ADY53637.1 esterase/lipase [Pseudopedobacter saltans DSM 12145]